MNIPRPAKPRQTPEAAHGSRASYITGFLLSLTLTMAAYLAVTEHWFHGSALVTVLIALAIVQLFVQLVFFLHLGRESKPRWNLTVFSFMLIVLIILVFGSLWIMKNLNYHMMSPHEIDKHMQDEEGIYR
jgi:cytochrome o ubiquinol oxidase subunit IV